MELDMDFLKSLISDFDLMSLLPEMAMVMEWIVKGVYYAVMAGPVILIVMGLLYLIFPTKEANHVVGYRFFWGMGSIKSWKFTQRFAGIVWALLGLWLGFDMFQDQSILTDLETLDMLYTAVEMILHQIVAVAISVVCINVFIFLAFNFRGEVRRPWVKLWNIITKKDPLPGSDKPRRSEK